MKLAIASIFTLGLLGVMLLAIIVPLLGNWDVGISIVFTFILFLVFWLVGPWFNDFLYGWFYQTQWIELSEFRKRSPASAAIVEKMAQKHSFTIPKIGIIVDNNPTAFCYGSGKWNPRLVVSEGIFSYLNEKEREAVIAHEMGHIANNDFIVMTIAAFLVTLMYHISRALMRSGKSNSGGKKGGNLVFFVIGIIAFVFYVIGTYLLLFLSRTREYLADEFSAQETKNPDALSSALVKIAFGLVQAPDTSKTDSLAEGTRTLGIYDYKAAKSFGIAYASDEIRTGKNKNGVLGAIQYDLHAIWAWWSELHSSHPLTGKRIGRLEEQKGSEHPYNVQGIRSMKVDKGRLWAEFVRDWLVTYFPIVLGS